MNWRIIHVIEAGFILCAIFLFGVSYGGWRATNEIQPRIAAVNHELENLRVEALRVSEACHALVHPLKVTVLDDGGAQLHVETKVLPEK